MELRLGSSGKKDAEDEPTKGNLAGGCCFDFNKVSACSYSEDDYANFRAKAQWINCCGLAAYLSCIVLYWSHARQQPISVIRNSSLLVNFTTVWLMQGQ